MCRRPHHRVVELVVVGRVIVCRARIVTVRYLVPPRGPEPREDEPRDPESRALNQAAVRARGRRRHAPVDHRRRTRPGRPDVRDVRRHCRVPQGHVDQHLLADVLVQLVVVQLLAVQLVDLDVDVLVDVHLELVVFD